MPDRIIRASILTSDAVNTLSEGAEVFYRRLMSVVDDYGRYDGRSSVLLGTLFMLQLSKVSEANVKSWMKECSRAGLIMFYEIDNRPYLEIYKFRQRLRAMKSRYPEPTNGCKEMTDASELLTNDSEVQTDVYDLLLETETETETETKQKRKEALTLVFPFSSEKFMVVWDLLLKEKKWRKKSFGALQASLELLSRQSEDDAIQMMKNTIAGEWQGLFEIDKSKKQNSNGKRLDKNGETIISGRVTEEGAARTLAGLLLHEQRKKDAAGDFIG